MDPVWIVGSEQESEDEGVQMSEWTGGHRVFKILGARRFLGVGWRGAGCAEWIGHQQWTEALSVATTHYGDGLPEDAPEPWEGPTDQLAAVRCIAVDGQGEVGLHFCGSGLGVFRVNDVRPRTSSRSTVGR